MIKNYMECMVEQLLPTVLDGYDNICKCSTCIQDMQALALNHLPPHYVCTEKGILYEKVNQLSDQFKADIIKEIVNAAKFVSNHPRHPKSSKLIK